MIAQRVGSDFGMEIKIGKPGKGSFFNPEENSITLDPNHIKENKDEAKFVAAHEGAHKAISKHPKEIGLAINKIRELYQKTGFAFLQNAIEDPAVNDWFQSKLPGLRQCTKENYDKQFEKEGAVLSSPEIQKIAQRLGYWPKFAKFGSEIIRNWHKGGFSKDLDEDVKRALNKTKKYFEKSIDSIPSDDPTDDEVVKKAQKRFKINTEKVWPEVEKLVEKDMENEEMRQQAQDIEKALEEIEKLKKKFLKMLV